MQTIREMNFIRRINLVAALCFTLLVQGTDSFAQSLLWTSCTVNTDIDFTYHAMNSLRKEIVVGGEAGRLTYRTAQAGMFSGNGKSQVNEYDIDDEGNYFFVYDFDGTLKWYYHSYSDDEHIDGVAYDKSNRLVGLIYRPLKERKGYDYYNDSDDEEEDGNEEEEETFCYKLCYFDNDGDVAESVCISELLDVEITDFKSHPDGGFVLAGHANEGRFTKNINLDAGKGGCDFLIFVDSTGKIIWGDALAYQKGSCCTYGAEPEIAFDSKGNVIIAGSYVGGARFGNSVTCLAVAPYTAGHSFSAQEAYVASYSSAGKFRWVRTAISLSTFGSLVAGNGNIYVSATMHRRYGEMFGEKVDTTNHENVFVTVFDETGKVKSNISTNSKGKVNLATDMEGNLVVTGTIGIEAGFLKQASTDPKKRRREDVYVAFYTKNGKFIVHHEYNLLKISSEEGPFCMALGRNDYFLGGSLFGALPISLRLLDPAFPDVEIYGSGTMIARCGKKPK